jgi:hypothetical protein
VIPPIQARPDGTYVLQLHEYDPGAYSDDTAVTDTVPSLGTGYASDSPPVVTQINTVISTTEYALVGMGTTGIYNGRVVLGDTGRNTVFGSNDIRLPNNVPIYGLKTGGEAMSVIKVNQSNGIEIGDGGETLFINSGGASVGVIIPNDVPLQAGWASPYQLAKYDSSNQWIELGDNGREVRVIGGTKVLIKTYQNDTGDPTSTHFPAYYWGMYRDTDAGKTYLVLNRAGTIEKVELT